MSETIAPVDIPAQNGSQQVAHPPAIRSRYPGEFLLLLLRNFLARNDLPLLRHLAAAGDVAQAQFGRARLVLLSHPDDIKRVLVTEQRSFDKGWSATVLRSKRLLGQGLLTSEGELHLRQRRLVQPAFHREQIARYAAVMADYTRRAVDRWHDGATFDLYKEMIHLTRDIAGKTLFDLDVGQDPGGVGDAVELSMRVYSIAFLLGPRAERLPLPVVARWRTAMARVDGWLAETILQRRAEGGRGDLLSMLLTVRDGEDSTSEMSDLQVRDEMVTILVAAHETTAVALSWACYLLSQHPEVERRLHAEVVEVLGDRVPTINDVPKLTYTRMVFAETLRMYPPAWVLERRALRDIQIREHNVPAGATVFVSPYLVHRDARWYSNPERFDPERWSTDADSGRPKFAYFPFGAGTRVCVGEQFAWMEGTLVLATIMQRWRLTHDPSHRVAFKPLVTLRPRFGMRMRATRRGA